MATEQNVKSIINIAGRLIELMSREIEILRAMRPNDIASLQAEKSALAAAYEDAFRNLAADRDAMASLAPALKEEFAEIIARFKQVMAENERALKAAKRAHDRLLQAIVQSVEECRDQNKGYSETGATAAADPKSQAPLSLALDTQL